MGASPDPRFIPILIEMAAKVEPYASEANAIFSVLVRSGDPKAIEAVLAKFASEENSYRLTSLARGGARHGRAGAGPLYRRRAGQSQAGRLSAPGTDPGRSHLARSHGQAPCCTSCSTRPKARFAAGLRMARIPRGCFWPAWWNWNL